MVAAGLEGHDQRATASVLSGLSESSHFGVGSASLCMESLPDEGSISIENDGSDKWIGTGVTIGQGCELQCSPHPSLPHQSKGMVCSERHSPTT